MEEVRYRGIQLVPFELIQIDLALTVEGPVTRQQNVESDTSAPDISLVRVGLLLQNLRRLVVNDLIVIVLVDQRLGFFLMAHSEVLELDSEAIMALINNHDVLHADVAVNYSLAVQEGQGFEELTSNDLDVAPFHAPVARLHPELQVVQERAVACQLLHDVEVLLVVQQLVGSANLLV